MLGFIGAGVVGTIGGTGIRAVYWHLLGISVVNEQTLIPLGIFSGILITMMGIAWWVGKLITRFEMSITEHTKELAEIKRMVHDLPCPGKTEVCGHKK